MVNLKNENEKKNISLRETYSNLLSSDQISADVKINSLKNTFDNVDEKFENISELIQSEKLNVVLEKLGFNSMSLKNINSIETIPDVEKEGNKKNKKKSNGIVKSSTAGNNMLKKKERGHRLKSTLINI